MVFFVGVFRNTDSSVNGINIENSGCHEKLIKDALKFSSVIKLITDYRAVSNSVSYPSLSPWIQRFEAKALASAEASQQVSLSNLMDSEAISWFRKLLR